MPTRLWPVMSDPNQPDDAASDSDAADSNPPPIFPILIHRVPACRHGSRQQQTLWRMWTLRDQTVVDLDDSVVSSTKSIHLHPVY